MLESSPHYILGFHGCDRSLKKRILTGKETLKDVGSLYVTIQKLPPDAAEIGLTPSMLRKDIELQLKGAGITIPFALVGNEEPYLNLVTDVSYDTKNDFVYYATHLSLIQPVSLLRDPTLSCAARTWFISSTAGAQKKESVKLLRDAIAKQVGIDKVLAEVLS